MTAAPPITSRASWGANPANTPAGSIPTPTPRLWLHHTASTGLHGAGGMRSLQQNALRGGYVDLEYNYVVDNPSGEIFMSRGPGRNSAAQGCGSNSENTTAHAICVMGNFQGIDTPSDACLSAIAQLLAYGHEQGWWPAAITGPHRNAPQCSTACCGDSLIAQIGEINRRAAGSAPGPGPKPPAPAGGAMDICRTPSGKGYWICAADGGVFCYGDAKFFGSMGGQHLNAPVVDMAARPQGDGYWLVAQDGGVFAFGKAPAQGSMAGKKLNAPIVSIECDAEGDGYWLLGQDGGIFTFGKTSFFGSAAGKVRYP